MVKRTVLPARERLLSSARKLNANELAVGYFADQGVHPGSQMTYPELMYLQEVKGVRTADGVVHRRLFETTANIYRQEILSTIRGSLKRNFSSNPKQVYTDTGNLIKARLTDGFGNLAIMPGNAASTVAKKGFNAPLVETGDLKHKLQSRVRGRTK